MSGRRGRGGRRWLPAVAAVALAAALAGCSSRFGMPEPKSEEGETILDVWRGMFWAAMAVGGIVWALIFWSIVRYRRRTDDLPTQVAHNVRVEAVYSVVPILIVAAIFFVTVRTEGDVSDVSGEPAVDVLVEGFQWQWQFTYVDEGVVVTGTPDDVPELVLPVGVPSRLELVAVDVNHSFWVPNFLEKRDLIQGVDNEIEVTPTEVGEYRGRCAEFCGLDHWRMSFAVRVVSEEDFAAWLDEQRAAA
ncbi:MAG TPA: cytochrome c oxidase subunit II [Acidimicrobiales bacterium]